jgi:hypothetical protein
MRRTLLGFGSGPRSQAPAIPEGAGRHVFSRSVLCGGVPSSIVAKLKREIDGDDDDEATMRLFTLIRRRLLKLSAACRI